VSGGRAPSRREVTILKALWKRGPARVRHVHERLLATTGLAFNSVQSIPGILDRGVTALGSKLEEYSVPTHLRYAENKGYSKHAALQAVELLG
jgi:hypothetical protein